MIPLKKMEICMWRMCTTELYKCRSPWVLSNLQKYSLWLQWSLLLLQLQCPLMCWGLPNPLFWLFFCWDFNIYNVGTTCSFSVLLSWPLVPPCYQKPWRHLKFLSPFCKFNQLTSFCWLFLLNAPYICLLPLISFSTLSWGLLSHTWKISAATLIDPHWLHTLKPHVDLAMSLPTWEPSLVYSPPWTVHAVTWHLTPSRSCPSHAYEFITSYLTSVPTHPSIQLTIHSLSIYSPAFQSTHLSIHPSIHPSIPLSITQ